MRIEMRVERNGRSIFRAEYYTEVGLSFAEYSKMALKEFHRQHRKYRCLRMTFGTSLTTFDKLCPKDQRRRRPTGVARRKYRKLFGKYVRALLEDARRRRDQVAYAVC